MTFKEDLRLLLKPYYLVNILLSLSYIIAKQVPFICSYLFSEDERELDGKETHILFFLLFVIMIRTRKSGSVTMIHYLSTSFVYTKITNLILWFYADIRMGILFAVIFIFCALILPEPTYQGPQNITFIRGANGLEEELNRDTRIVWVVAFYTAWNPACNTFAPIYSQLSAEYALENLRFGKIDIGRFPDAGLKYHVSDASTSKQLPTIILFKNAKEVDRRPYADKNGKLVKFLFSLDNMKAAFDLNNIYKFCKTNPLKKKEKKSIKAE